MEAKGTAVGLVASSEKETVVSGATDVRLATVVVGPLADGEVVEGPVVILVLLELEVAARA
jgi:hypothetical protein